MKKEARETNTEMARARQRKHASYASKKFGEAIGVEVGDAVVVTVDYRDRGKSNPTKLFGLVTEVGKGFGVKVFTQSGMLARGKGKIKNSMFIPHGQWQKTDNPHPTVLNKTKAELTLRKFNENEHPKISMAEAHQKQTMQVTKTGQRKCRCKIKKSNGIASCSNCVCSKAGLLCSSSCACGGNCVYMLKRSEQSTVI